MARRPKWHERILRDAASIAAHTADVWTAHNSGMPPSQAKRQRLKAQKKKAKR